MDKDGSVASFFCSGYSRRFFSQAGFCLRELHSLLRPTFLSGLSTSRTAPNTARPPPTAPGATLTSVTSWEFNEVEDNPFKWHLVRTPDSASFEVSFFTLLDLFYYLKLTTTSKCNNDNSDHGIADRGIYFIYCQQITMN